MQQVSEWVSEMASGLGTLASSEPEEEEESGTPEEVGAGLQMRGGGGGGGGGGEHPAVDDSSTSVGERIVLIPLEHTQSVLAFVNTTGRESSFGMFPLNDWDHGLGQGGGFGAGGIDVEKVFPELKTAVHSFFGI